MVTIADVAAKAGVGAGTVSRVLNESPRVSATTRARVLAAIEALDYRPNPLAQGLSRGRCQTLGAVVPFFTHASAVERLRGVVPRLDGSRYDLVLFNVESPVHRDEHLASLTRRDRADGLLVVSMPPPPADDGPPERRRHPRRAARRPLPRPADGRHRRRRGRPHRHPAPAVARPRAHRLPGRRPRQPVRVHLQRRARAGLPRGRWPRPGSRSTNRWCATAPTSATWPGRLTEQLLSGTDRPTAVFAASDTQALGVLEGARAAGLDVPATCRSSASTTSRSRPTPG